VGPELRDTPWGGTRAGSSPTSFPYTLRQVQSQLGQRHTAYLRPRSPKSHRASESLCRARHHRVGALRLHARRHRRTRVTETGSGVPRGISYAYDALYRLTAADYSTGEAYAYRYDAAGNRSTMTSTTPLSGTVITAYTCDAAHRRTPRKDWPAKPSPVPTRYSPSRSLVIRESLH